MSCDDPVVQSHAATIKRIKKELKELRLKAARYDWLAANAVSDGSGGWMIPTLISSDVNGVTIPFGKAIDVARNQP